MLMPLSILPIVLLLVHGATSVDQYKSKRVPRRNTEVTRSFNLNHPLSVENYDTVLPGNQEVIQVKHARKIGARKIGVITEDKNKSLKNTTGRITVNHPPSAENYDPIPISDYEGEIILNSKARSIDIKAPFTVYSEREKNKLKTAERASVETEIKTEHQTKRNRSQKVRKVKVNKSQLEVYVNETENTADKPENIVNKVAQKVSLETGIDQTRSRKSIKSHESFKRREQLRDPVVPIIESESYVYSHSGNFHYSYEGGDGTKAYERGELKRSNGGAGSAVQGNFSYTDKDGNDFSLAYTADENGYRPVGAHLPTPPPIPLAIQRALDLLATKATPEPFTERVQKL